MSTKEKSKVEKFAKGGLFNLYETSTKGNYIMVFCLADKEPMVIPFLASSEGNFAYVNNSLRPMYSVITNLITLSTTEGIYKELRHFAPLLGNAPEHDKTISKFVQNTFGVKSNKADEAVKAAGYTLPELKTGSSTATKDYSEISKVEKYKALIDDNHARLVKDNISYKDLSQSFKDAFDDCLKNVTKGAVFTGPAGTGKTKAIEVFADHIGAPMKSVIFNSQTKESDLMGKYIPNPDTNSEAKYIFVKGPLLEAATDGFPFVGQEANYMKSNNLIIFNQLLDDTGVIEYNGTSFKVHPNFMCFFTMNCGAKGSEPFYKSLKNRIEAIYIPAQPVSEFTAWIQKAIKATYDIEVPEDLCKELYNFTSQVTKEAVALHETAEFSVRDAIRVCKAIYSKEHTFEQFKDVLCRNYVNKLSLDYDRGDKIKAYTSSEVFKNSVKKLYSFYNFSVLEEKESAIKLEDVIAESTTSTESILEDSESSEKTIDATMDDILASGLDM